MSRQTDSSPLPAAKYYYYYYNHFTALWILPGTTRVSPYQ